MNEITLFVFRKEMAMSATNPIVNANPIVNPNPIVNANPIVSDNPIQSPLIEGGDVYDPNRDFSCGCSATIPEGSRMFFMKFCLIVMVVGTGVMYGLYKLSEAMGWM